MTIDDNIRDEKLKYDINRESAKISSLSSSKTENCEYFKKQTKMIEEQERKQIDAITNQSERLAALTNKDYHKDNYKEIFEELVKERRDEIKELTDEINQNDLWKSKRRVISSESRVQYTS